MGAVLEALLDLQDIELQIVDIRRQMEQKARLVRRQSTRLQSMQEQLSNEREAFRRSQMDVDEIDVTLKSHTAHVARLREQLNSVRTNREYSSILDQLNNEKADSSRLEARALQLMEGMEVQRKTVEEREREEQAEAARLADLQAQSTRVENTFADKLAQLEQRRDELSERLDGQALGLFERLSERYEGEVLARIERTHPRRDEFSCGGCHMTLSAESANAAMTRDEVQTCRNCGRILYIEKGT